ncbi:MAG: GAF domain-containing protein [Deltaproteobacteria bacterium]|nr:GAF domain-containing protein [Deltaproteobacteria bacterium]
MQPPPLATRFRDGPMWQRALFALIVAVYFAGLGLSIDDKRRHLGEPDVGFIAQGRTLSPSRPDAAAAGLRGGGLAVEINGWRVVGGVYAPGSRLRTEIGERNLVTIRTPGGETRQFELEVRPWTWADMVFTESGTMVLGALFFVVGVISFVLRPWDPGAWSLLVFCTLVGGAMSNLLLRPHEGLTLQSAYMLCVLPIIRWVPLHLGLAFPVVHSLLLRRPWLVPAIYAGAALDAGLNLLAWFQGGGPLFGAVELFGLLVMGGGVLFFAGRCALLSMNRDRLVAQRARIVAAGVIFGCGPPVAFTLERSLFGDPGVDARLVFWSLSLFLLALGWVTLRHDLMNARLAVRRGVVYGLAVGVLTALAVLLVSVRPLAVALLIGPLLYWWPRFNDRLERWLYPKRRKTVEIVRAIGAELGGATRVDEVLDRLSSAPARLADASTGAAFLFAGVAGPEERVRASGFKPVEDGHRIEEDVLIQMLVMTRNEVSRRAISIEPQYSKIRDECVRSMDRLGAEILLPILQREQVIGALAVGRRATDDVYERFELDVLTTLAQQAVQAVDRIGATERLRERELEFADLKRFFSPVVIDQVMARGGVAELRSQRKLVTVFFADLRGFTSFSDSVEPEEVMATLSEYHEAMGVRVAEFAGTLERFAGDGFMVFFNDPVDQPDHVDRAVKMALAMREDVSELHTGWLRRGYEIGVGMGIHTGYATCGFIGYEGRRDYGVIGNVTNLAARLSDRASAGEILISARVGGELGTPFQSEPIGDIELKGFVQAQSAHRLVGRA